jgi:hypothetical protein
MALICADVELIAKTLMGAKRPLVITSYLGRNLQAPALLEELCDKLPISVVEMVGSDVCIRSDHEAYRGVTVTTHPDVLEADVIIVMDCDVPWIPTAGEPKKGRFLCGIAVSKHLLTIQERKSYISMLTRSSSRCHVCDLYFSSTQVPCLLSETSLLYQGYAKAES